MLPKYHIIATEVPYTITSFKNKIVAMKESLALVKEA